MSLSLFWGVAAALLLLAMGLLAQSLWRRPSQQPLAHSARQANLAVLRAQLLQLDDERASGVLNSAQHAQSRADIERRVLEEESVAAAPDSAGSRRTTAALVLLAVPALAIALYAHLGSQRALSGEAAGASAAEPSAQDIEVLVTRLADRMAAQPPGRVEDAEGWAMLGRTYAALQRYPQAGDAIAKARQLTPDDAQLIADQADVLAMQQGQSLRGQPTALIDRALQIDPNNLKALALAGSAAFERQDFANAVKHWRAASRLVPPDSEFARGLQGSLAEAQTALNASAASAPGPATSSASSAALAGRHDAELAGGAASLSGRVSLAPALAARVSPDDTVFIFARAAEGPRIPLAIMKRQARELPIDFTLDDSQAMTPQMKLSAFPTVVLGARISKSGNATPNTGDLQGQVGPLPNRGAHVQLLIDSVQP
ncbi:MAG: c-type cytochrome biogenesis protein CcmI [Rubrivivax sp.]